MHIKGILRQEQNDTLALPGTANGHVDASGAPTTRRCSTKQLTLSPHGTVAADSISALMRRWATTTSICMSKDIGGAGSFYVEDYKKPEYQVTVKPAVARVLQGDSIQATINARYFFGEPVAGAKVTYVVHTSTHYWWDQDEGTITAITQTPIRMTRTVPTMPTTPTARPNNRSTRACSTQMVS